MAFAAAGVQVGSAIFNNTTIYPSYPAGVVANSPLFMFVAHANQATVVTKTITVPTTWQLVSSGTLASIRGLLYYTVAGSSVSSTVTVAVQITTDTTLGTWGALIVRWSGILTSTTAFTAQGFSTFSSSQITSQPATWIVPSDIIEAVFFNTSASAEGSFTGESGADLTFSAGAAGVGGPCLAFQSAVATATGTVTAGTYDMGLAAALGMSIAITVQNTTAWAKTASLVPQTFGGLGQTVRMGMDAAATLGQTLGGLALLSSATPGGNSGALNPQTLAGMLLSAAGTPGGNSGALNPQIFGSLGIALYGSAQSTAATSSTGVRFCRRGRHRIKARNR